MPRDDLDAHDDHNRGASACHRDAALGARIQRAPSTSERDVDLVHVRVAGAAED
jgi:hypothetical protein